MNIRAQYRATPSCSSTHGYRRSRAAALPRYSRVTALPVTSNRLRVVRTVLCPLSSSMLGRGVQKNLLVCHKLQRLHLLCADHLACLLLVWLRNRLTLSGFEIAVRDRGRKNRLTGDEKCTKLSRGDTVGRTGDASPVSPAVATPLFLTVIFLCVCCIRTPTRLTHCFYTCLLYTSPSPRDS